MLQTEGVCVHVMWRERLCSLEIWSANVRSEGWGAFDLRVAFFSLGRLCRELHVLGGTHRAKGGAQLIRLT